MSVNDTIKSNIDDTRLGRHFYDCHDNPNVSIVEANGAFVCRKPFRPSPIPEVTYNSKDGTE
jgi:hypothetical protein